MDKKKLIKIKVNFLKKKEKTDDWFTKELEKIGDKPIQKPLPVK